MVSRGLRGFEGNFNGLRLPSNKPPHSYTNTTIYCRTYITRFTLHKLNEGNFQNGDIPFNDIPLLPYSYTSVFTCFSSKSSQD